MVLQFKHTNRKQQMEAPKGSYEAVFGHLGMTPDEIGNRMVALQSALEALLEHEGETEVNGIGMEFDSAALEQAKMTARALLNP